MKLHFTTMRIFFPAVLMVIAALPALSQEEKAGWMVATEVSAGTADGEYEPEKGDSITTDTLATDSTEAALPWPQDVQARLDRLLEDKLFETTQVGLMIWDLDADSAIYRHNEKHRMRPASTQKIVTAVTALDFLGTNYMYRTELRYKGGVEDSTRTLRGDIYCIGGMDPMFGEKDLSAFADSIRSLGIDTIAGNIYADLSFKDKNRFGEGWCWDDDNPILSPLLLDGKDRFLEALCKRIESMGIVLSGTTAELSEPAGNTILLCTREHPIKDVLHPVMKRSDNLYAETLFYQIAHRQGGRHASAKMARRRIDAMIRKSEARDRDSHSADGSGLSLYNYETPEIEVMLLRYAFRNEETYRILLWSMPVAGIDGTLRKRMKGTAAENNVRAKTGTVNGVSALAGYCTARNGHRLCFAIMNQGIRNSYEGRRFQDNVCTELCR